MFREKRLLAFKFNNSASEDAWKELTSSNKNPKEQSFNVSSYFNVGDKSVNETQKEVGEEIKTWGGKVRYWTGYELVKNTQENMAVKKVQKLEKDAHAQYFNNAENLLSENEENSEKAYETVAYAKMLNKKLELEGVNIKIETHKNSGTTIEKLDEIFHFLLTKKEYGIMRKKHVLSLTNDVNMQRNKGKLVDKFVIPVGENPSLEMIKKSLVDAEKKSVSVESYLVEKYKESDNVHVQKILQDVEKLSIQINEIRKQYNTGNRDVFVRKKYKEQVEILAQLQKIDTYNLSHKILQKTLSHMKTDETKTSKDVLRQFSNFLQQNFEIELPKEFLNASASIEKADLIENILEITELKDDEDLAVKKSFFENRLDFLSKSSIISIKNLITYDMTPEEEVFYLEKEQQKISEKKRKIQTEIHKIAEEVENPLLKSVINTL